MVQRRNSEAKTSVFFMLFLVIVTLASIAAFNVWYEGFSITIQEQIEENVLPGVITGSLTRAFNEEIITFYKKTHSDSKIHLKHGGNLEDLQTSYKKNPDSLLCITTPLDSNIKPDLTETCYPVAYETICVVTNAKNINQSSKTMTRSELQAIYQKNSTSYPTWYDDSFVRYTIQPPQSSSDIEQHFCHLLLGISESTLTESSEYHADVCLPNQTIMKRALTTGVSAIGYLQKNIAEHTDLTILSFQGTHDTQPIPPEIINLDQTTNRYDGIITIQYVTKKNHYNSDVSTLIDCILDHKTMFCQHQRLTPYT